MKMADAKFQTVPLVLVASPTIKTSDFDDGQPTIITNTKLRCNNMKKTEEKITIPFG